MAYRHDRLAQALAWVSRGREAVRQAITTSDGYLTGWLLGDPRPSEEEQRQAVQDYEDYLASMQYRDETLAKFLASPEGKVMHALMLTGIEKGLWTMADVQRHYRVLP